MRHLVVKGAIDPMYLDELFPIIKDNFSPQEVHYNGGVAKVKDWRISCYLEVMDGGVPCTNPNLDLLSVCTPLLESCDDMFISEFPCDVCGTFYMGSDFVQFSFGSD